MPDWTRAGLQILSFDAHAGASHLGLDTPSGGNHVLRKSNGHAGEPITFPSIDSDAGGTQVDNTEGAVRS